MAAPDGPAPRPTYPSGPPPGIAPGGGPLARGGPYPPLEPRTSSRVGTM